MPKTVSAVVARILEQLSVSAWLPSAILVAALTFVGHLAVQQDGDVVEATRKVSSLEPVALVLLFGLVVMLTTLTQAFEFAAIRFVEGYWGARGPLAGLAKRLIAAQQDRLAELEVRETELKRQAIASCRDDIEQRYPADAQQIVDALENRVLGTTHNVEDRHTATAAAYSWRGHADAAIVRSFIATVRARDKYPETSYRILPTRIGNTIRAAEEHAFGRTVSNLEGKVLLVFEELPVSIQLQHDLHRRQLNLYCTLLFVAVFLGAVSATTLGLVHGWTYAVTSLGLAAAVAFVTWQAAVLASEGYASTLETIGEWSEAS